MIWAKKGQINSRNIKKYTSNYTGKFSVLFSMDAGKRAKSFLHKMDVITHILYMSYKQQTYYLANILDLLDSWHHSQWD